MTTIQVRIDDKTKRSAKKILDELNIDMSSAIKVYLKQIAVTRGIPFPLVTENGLTPRQERDILEAAREARDGKNVSKPMSMKESVEYLLSLA